MVPAQAAPGAGGCSRDADQPPADTALDPHLDHDPAHLTLSLSLTHPNPIPDLDLFLHPVKPCSFNVYRPFYRLKCDFVEFLKKQILLNCWKYNLFLKFSELVLGRADEGPGGPEKAVTIE